MRSSLGRIVCAALLPLILCQIACAEVHDLSKYDKAAAGPRRNIVVNGDFEQGYANWNLRAGEKVIRGAGRNGSGGLVRTRTDPTKYLLSSQVIPAKAGNRYEFGAWIKAENVKGSSSGGTVCVEFFDKSTNKYLSGIYLGVGAKGNSDWKLITGKFSVPDNAKTTIVLYLERKMTGTVCYDDVYVRPEGDLWAAYVSHPSHNTVTTNSPRLRIAVARNGDLPPKNLKLAVQLELENGYKVAAPVVDGQAMMDLAGARLDAGKTYGCKLYVLNTARKTLLHETNLPLCVRSESESVPTGTVRILPNGVATVDGKKFMPLGFFASSVTPKVIKHLVESGCNTVLPYCVLGTRPTREGIRKQFDMLRENNLKIIVNIKDLQHPKYNVYTPTHYNGRVADAYEITRGIVSEFKDHPALLAWYTNDECSISKYTHLKAMRELVNEIDPNHPVWGVVYQFMDLPNYGPTTDVSGIDPYVISGNNGTLGKVKFAMGRANKTHLPVWVVPEAFNNNVYARKDKRGLYRTPTEQEIRSMALQMAGMGAKGFIFYKLDDNWSHKLPKDHFDKFWPGMRRVLKTLRQLEPYILSDHSIKTVPLQTSSGEVDAFLLTSDEGKQAVIVTSSAGKGEAVLGLGSLSAWRSSYGKTVVEDGRLVFRGGSMDSDVLFRD